MKTYHTMVPILILILLSISACSNSSIVDFALYGEEEVTVNLGSQYIDEGAYAIVDGQDMSNQIQTNSNLDVDSLGDYTIEYQYTDAILYRHIHVLDTQPPKISLGNGDTVYIPLDTDEYIPEYTAYDNHDGDITHLVQISTDLDTSKIGQYYCEYIATDSNNNTAKITQTIVVDNTVLSSDTQDFSLEGLFEDTIIDETQLDATAQAQYLDETIFIGDSRSCYFIWMDFIPSSHGWGAQSLTPININEVKIDQFFTKKRDYAINLITDFRPKRIILTMGIDCIGSSQVDTIIGCYRGFLQNVMILSPDTTIIVHNIMPVDGAIEAEEAQSFIPTNAKINQVNYHLAQMCQELDIHFLYSAPVLKDENGLGISEYFEDDMCHLTYEGQKLVFDYITSHPYID